MDLCASSLKHSVTGMASSVRHPRLRAHHWGLALGVALLAHLAAARLLEPPPIQPEEASIRIALGGAGPAGGEGLASSASAVAAIDAVDVPATSLVAPVTTIPHASAPAAPTPLVARDVAVPLRATTPTERVSAREPPPTRMARAKPKPESKPRETPPRVTPRESAKADSPAPREATGQSSNPRVAASSGTATGPSGTSSGRGATAASGGGGGGGGTGKANGGKTKERYYADLAAWLERHKRYPQRARQLRQEGVVRVRFVIDRGGRLVSHRIEKGSGHAALDEAASDLLRRASPMPAIPASLGQSRLEIVVPIAYRLR